MDVKDYIKYCLFVEEVGWQLEQRALDGGGVPPVLRTRAAGAYRQKALGIHVAHEPPGKFGPTPDVPAVFPVRTVRIKGKGDVRVPEVAAVRVLISLFDTGFRMGELLGATRASPTRLETGDVCALRLPNRPRTGGSAGPTPVYGSLTARMLARELEVRQRIGLESPLAFTRLDGLRLVPGEITRAKTVIWEAFLFEFGVPRTTPRPNPRAEKAKELYLSGQLQQRATKYLAPTVRFKADGL